MDCCYPRTCQSLSFVQEMSAVCCYAYILKDLSAFLDELLYLRMQEGFSTGKLYSSEADVKCFRHSLDTERQIQVSLSRRSFIVTEGTTQVAVTGQRDSEVELSLGNSLRYRKSSSLELTLDVAQD
jgi:hypothetical protein